MAIVKLASLDEAINSRQKAMMSSRSEELFCTNFKLDFIELIDNKYVPLSTIVIAKKLAVIVFNTPPHILHSVSEPVNLFTYCNAIKEIILINK